MGSVHIDLFVTLDGVAQAPGAPEEDTSGGFPFGGWQAPLMDDLVGREVMAGLERMDALLLGRRTYDIFAAYWPHQEGDIARQLNAVPKYVASRGKPDLSWADSSLLGPDVVEQVRAVRDRHQHTHVIGSVDFVQTLLAERLFDVLTLWVYPVVLGQGKKVFPDGARASGLTLLEPPVAGSAGAVQLRYAPTGADPGTGDMTVVDAQG
ncbi:dihydrofolate reductase family protein [Cellulomonas sp. ICMP 17802]|uniref:dihydrofolate reductase family protein n=1 Tax=Cellulomonas sp. ICMP 17802 TaxID=3239199 RepID=UPI00351B6654